MSVIVDAEDSVYQSIQAASPALFELIRRLDAMGNDSLCGFIQAVFVYLVHYGQAKRLMSNEPQLGHVIFDSVSGILKAEVREKPQAGGFPIYFSSRYGRTKLIRRMYETNTSFKNFLTNLFIVTQEISAFYGYSPEKIHFVNCKASFDGRWVLSEIKVPRRIFSPMR